MAKKAAKKKSRTSEDPNALGLTGPGVEAVRIASLTRKINEYEVIKNERCSLTPREVAAKQAVVSEMEKHADKLRAGNGNLIYHLEDNRYVEIEPAKVRIKFKDEKPQKKSKKADKEPEEQLAEDQQD